ncbi:TetR/AcrR family transcriptional regulator [Cryptosporangium sp. NPDC051539]|uniref:TetR/AcrR family transcriptional regulator n=1 Tax=Cryptosporangium sp. NPDC051539 TaxID=3363962 RepID=UPI0037A92045
MQTSRGRRKARPSGDERESAILATAERLLGERPFAEISIDDLARGAGISRPTFYFYFASKEAVLLSLLDRVGLEAHAGATDALEHSTTDDPRALWRAAIRTFYETFSAHRSVALAAAQARTTSAEVGALWAGIVEGWVSRTQLAIESERARGAAPAGPTAPPARDLAIALTAMNERVIHGTFGGLEPAIAGPDVVDVLLGVWLAAIYQGRL